MQAGLTADTFEGLLGRLDADRERAGEKYEDLRRTLVRFFEWRGAPHPDRHADEVLNRLARRLAEGVEVRNVRAYCHEVARRVLQEAAKGRDARTESLESMRSEPAVEESSADEARERERRLACLEECLRALPAGGAELVQEYYGDGGRGHIERRKALAGRLGLRRDALANRVQRLRDKLERCVSGCLGKKSAV
jgi:DNA-directed RNA polymerase specialized sigma24 family protein